MDRKKKKFENLVLTVPDCISITVKNLSKEEIDENSEEESGVSSITIKTGSPLDNPKSGQRLGDRSLCICSNCVDPEGRRIKLEKGATRNHICPYANCDKVYAKSFHLRRHILSHGGGTPHGCDWPGCGRSFARSDQLRRHSKIHSGIKAHQCPACCKRFARSDHLKKHIRSHLRSSEFLARRGKQEQTHVEKTTRLPRGQPHNGFRVSGHSKTEVSQGNEETISVIDCDEDEAQELGYYDDLEKGEGELEEGYEEGEVLTFEVEEDECESEEEVDCTDYLTMTCEEG